MICTNYNVGSRKVFKLKLTSRLRPSSLQTIYFSYSATLTTIFKESLQVCREAKCDGRDMKKTKAEAVNKTTLKCDYGVDFVGVTLVYRKKTLSTSVTTAFAVSWSRRVNFQTSDVS